MKRLICQKYGHKGISGFVNGILRNFSRNKEDLIKVKEKPAGLLIY